MTKMKEEKMEDDQNGRRPKWKKTKMEDDQNGKRPKWKTIKMENKTEIQGRSPLCGIFKYQLSVTSHVKYKFNCFLVFIFFVFLNQNSVLGSKDLVFASKDFLPS